MTECALGCKAHRHMHIFILKLQTVINCWLFSNVLLNWHLYQTLQKILSASHISWLGCPWGNSANSHDCGIPFQEHFHTTISRWRKAGRRVINNLQPVFKVCYNPSQFSPASSSHLKSQAFFFLVISYMIFLRIKSNQHTRHTYPPKASSVYFVPVWATILSYRISTVSCIFRKHMVEDVLHVSLEMDCLKPVLTALSQYWQSLSCKFKPLLLVA